MGASTGDWIGLDAQVLELYSLGTSYGDIQSHLSKMYGVEMSKAVYTIYGVDADGNRDILFLYIGKEEGAKTWGRVLDKIQDRGVEDVLFFAIPKSRRFKWF